MPLEISVWELHDFVSACFFWLSVAASAVFLVLAAIVGIGIYKLTREHGRGGKDRTGAAVDIDCRLFSQLAVRGDTSLTKG